MTLATETVRVQYDGDGSTVTFPVTFVFWGADDLQVILTDSGGNETVWTRGTEYTVTGGTGLTGSVTVETDPTDYTPAIGETLTIKSDLADLQSTDFPLGGALLSTAIEQTFDKVVRLIQQRTEELGRTIKLKISSPFSELTLPEPLADRVLGWNSDGDDLENKTPNTDTYLSTPIAIPQGGTGATTAATARTALGVYSTAQVDSAISAAAGAVIFTGFTIPYIGSTAPSGWLILNGDTIGDAGSGATQASADHEDLFALFWDSMADSEAPVSTGRGASAAADWAAGKTLTMPDARGRALIGSGTGTDLTARTHGDTDGAETHTLVDGELPTTTIRDPSASETVAFGDSTPGGVAGDTNTTFGSDGAHNNMQPWLALNWIVKV